MPKSKNLVETLFAGKLRFRVLRIAGQDFRSRIMHGYLAYRGNVGESATLGEISRATGLSRTSACLLARDSLLNAKLIYEGDGSRWHAIEPTEDISPIVGEYKRWSNNHAYDWYVPVRQGCGLTLVDGWIYWMLWSLDRGNVGITTPQCLAGIAKLSGLHRATIATTLKTLKSHGMIRIARAKGSREYFQVGMLEPTAEIMEFFQDFGTKLNSLLFLDENGNELETLRIGEKKVGAETQTSDVALVPHAEVATVDDVDDHEDDADDDDDTPLIVRTLAEYGITGKRFDTVWELIRKCKWIGDTVEEKEDDIVGTISILDGKKKGKDLYPLLVTDLKRRKI